MSPGSNTVSYPAFAHIGLRENSGKNLNQVLYEAETWALRQSEEKRIEAFEMWIWRRMERVKWTDRIRNEAVLERVAEQRMMLKLIRNRKMNWLGHWLRRNYLLKDALEGMVNGRRVRGRRIYQMIDDIKIYGSYAETKRKIPSSAAPSITENAIMENVAAVRSSSQQQLVSCH
ncbi:hypothetical protein ANN_25168 [Periplaneta americana]|uniref:Uncharacterized protein n=1 Tax=Periplaneta americana TaxID=6978 RepID=A0ABQ8S0X5_PERAM|nr:hypothetical protein ANN_25168 [Periplaneta americana]